MSKSDTVADVKKRIGTQKKKLQDINRVELRQEPKGKPLKDETTLQTMGLENQGMLYLKDRGPQVGWVTVFLVEYFGPLVVYAGIYTRPWLFYGEGAADKPYHWAVE